MRAILTFANVLSLLRIVLTLLFISLLLISYHMIAFLIFFLAALTDYFDGYVARLFNEVSQTGNFLDPLADKILVLSAFSVFSYLGFIAPCMVLVIAVREVGVTIMRVVMNYKKTPLVTSQIGKIKTSVQFCTLGLMFFILLGPDYVPFFVHIADYLYVLLWFANYAVTILALYSVLHYIASYMNLEKHYE